MPCPKGLAAIGLVGLAAVAISASPSSAYACAGAGAAPGSVSTKVVGQTVVCLLNQRRARHGLGELNPNRSLNAAARRHSRYMTGHNCFDHVCPGEPDVSQRLHDYLAGARSATYGENIAWGSGELGAPKAIVQAWMHSPPHRENILNPRFDEIGVGVVWRSPNGSGTPAGTYTTDFGYTSG